MGTPRKRVHVVRFLVGETGWKAVRVQLGSDDSSAQASGDHAVSDARTSGPRVSWRLGPRPWVFRRGSPRATGEGPEIPAAAPCPRRPAASRGRGAGG